MRKLLLAATMMSLAFTACKKSKTEEPVPAPVPKFIGLWKGTFRINGGSVGDVIYYFKNDGTMRVYNGVDTASAAAKGSGIWVLQPPTTIVSEYTYTSSSTSFFSSKIFADADYTVGVATQWGTGKLISSPATYIEKGTLSISKQ
jgi:hypothetical protein